MAAKMVVRFQAVFSVVAQRFSPQIVYLINPNK